MDQLPRLGKRELICLQLFTCNNVFSVWRGFLFLWVLGMGYVILFWHSLSLLYNYFQLYQVSFLVLLVVRNNDYRLWTIRLVSILYSIWLDGIFNLIRWLIEEFT